MRISTGAIVLFGTLGLVSTQISPTQHATACDDSALPTSVRDLLNAKFSDWRPKQVSDMNADDQQVWLTAVHGKKSPGIAVGHFQTADELSYSLFLVPQTKPKHRHKSVA